MYKDLMLNRENILQAIDFFCSCNYKEYNIDEVKSPRYTRYNVEFDGNNMFIDVYYNKKGGTTLQTTNGKFREEKEKLAAFIANSDCCKIASNNRNRTIVYKTISAYDFETIIKLICEEEYCSAVVNRNDYENSVIIKLEGKWSDKATVTYYKSTKTVMLQGRPLALFLAIDSTFNEFIKFDDIIESLDQSYQLDTSKESIEEQYIALLPKAHKFLTEKQEKSLKRAVYNLNLPPQEYTCTELVFEALRALEGHIKLTLLKDYQIKPNNNGNLYIFRYDDEKNSVSIISPYDSKIADEDRLNYYKKAYKYLKVFRHKIFHWDYPDDTQLDETEQIDDVNDAKTIIKDALKLIDEYY